MHHDPGRESANTLRDVQDGLGLAVDQGSRVEAAGRVEQLVERRPPRVDARRRSRRDLGVDLRGLCLGPGAYRPARAALRWRGTTARNGPALNRSGGRIGCAAATTESSPSRELLALPGRALRQRAPGDQAGWLSARIRVAVLAATSSLITTALLGASNAADWSASSSKIVYATAEGLGVMLEREDRSGAVQLLPAGCLEPERAVPAAELPDDGAGSHADLVRRPRETGIDEQVPVGVQMNSIDMEPIPRGGCRLGKRHVAVGVGYVAFRVPLEEDLAGPDVDLLGRVLDDRLPGGAAD